jgi:hypothetical protein
MSRHANSVPNGSNDGPRTEVWGVRVVGDGKGKAASPSFKALLPPQSLACQFNEMAQNTCTVLVKQMK